MGDASSGSNGGAASEGANFDSYIGSLISLTSKSDIRYEGILYTIDAENCNIALQNVRSYGTEGRKKEGPQILPKDSVYDYIIFRGSDIKDLQVKSSPQAHAVNSQAYNDPAIIAQSQQPQKPQRVSSSGMAPPVGIPPPSPQVPAGFPHSQVMPSHAPLGIPPPRDAGLLPPGFINSSYPPVGPWGPRPPPPNGPMPPMYWQGYYPGQSPYMPHHMPPERPVHKPEVASSPPAHPIVVPTSEAAPGLTAVVTPIATRLPRIAVPQPPLELVEQKKDVVSSEPSPAAEQTKTQVQETLVASPSNEQVSLKPEAVKLENPRAEHPHPHPRNDNGRHNWRGNGRRGGRGRGPFHRTQNFTEDFDFIAMNEKFNKNEVWGELGKAGSPEDEDVGDKSWQKAEDPGKKGVYVKDDFFDSLSCDSLDREGGHTERPRFSEQRKINTETFGDAFLRSRGRGNYRGGYHQMGGRGGGNYRRGGGGGGRPHQAAAV